VGQRRCYLPNFRKSSRTFPIKNLQNRKRSTGAVDSIDNCLLKFEFAQRWVIVGTASQRPVILPFAAADATKATGTRGAIVWILLLHMAWKTKSTTFPLSNVMLARYGVSREMKRRVLEKLEASGRIKIERRWKRNPIVTLLTIKN
jgi:hypothetical protein